MTTEPADRGRVQLARGQVEAVWLFARGKRYLVAVADDRKPPILKSRLPLVERLVLIGR